ncbi:MAG: AmmeMemoRadiSam system radical SAM enzyme [Candidatus Aenigmarchaeota archaeon ex4484_56]|nr:MAG: AmmeMemoRadiSam system radical SAM enzyme [Candidatus Aenigmarchaeota archaeon ex4484_56]
MKEALFYRKLKNKQVKCLLCPKGCEIYPNSTGFCRVRKNIEGTLYSVVYGRPCTLTIDPIEKKPLYHFFPGTTCLSVSTVGCNFACTFCQNFEISQGRIFGEFVTPEVIVKLAKKYNVKSIAYTYTEPTIFFEYAYDTMKLAKREGLYNVWISNGYINKLPIKKISKYLDAVNIDIKGDEQVYKELCYGTLNPVLESLKEFKSYNNIWIEITNLVIPTYNDNVNWIKKLVNWIYENLGENTPLHLSRFHPVYKLNYLEPTSIAKLKKFYTIARKKLNYVYLGNIFEGKYESTYCKKCNKPVIDRQGYSVSFISNICKICNTKIEGVF